MKLRALAPAEAEITQAHDYLEAKLPSLGGRFLDDLTATLSEISRQPLRFQKLETLPPDQPYRRALLSIFRYAVIYEILSDEILIVAVCHTCRESNYWLTRRTS